MDFRILFVLVFAIASIQCLKGTVALSSGIYVKVESCSSGSKVGDVCTLTPSQMRPSQFGIGGTEVQCKQDRFESMTPSELEDYLKAVDKRVNIVVGRKDHFHVLDGHHMSVALLNADIPEDEKVIYCNVIQNWNSLEKEDFWQNMVADNYVWLYDEKGMSPIAPEYLPSHMEDMLDDPFRTLAWMLQDAGGYLKVGVNFEDFLWANFLRDNIDLNEMLVINSTGLKNVSSSDPHSLHANGSQWSWCQVRPNSPQCLPEQVQKLRTALPIALNLAKSPQAASLPGYGSGVIKPPNCGNATYLDFVAKIGREYTQ